MQLNYCPSDGLEGLCLVDRLCGTKEQCVLLPFRAGHFAKVEGRKVVFDWYIPYNCIVGKRRFIILSI